MWDIIFMHFANYHSCMDNVLHSVLMTSCIIHYRLRVCKGLHNTRMIPLSVVQKCGILTSAALYVRANTQIHTWVYCSTPSLRSPSDSLPVIRTSLLSRSCSSSRAYVVCVVCLPVSLSSRWITSSRDRLIVESKEPIVYKPLPLMTFIRLNDVTSTEPWAIFTPSYQSRFLLHVSY